MLAVSYAKINLFLEVTGKLPNNYHRVNTVLCSIDLCDFIHYLPNSSGTIDFTCSIQELNGHSNLVYRVAAYLKNRFHVAEGISIHLDKRIPIAAGLGGGSSNAANCMLALNEIWRLGLTKIEQHAIASQFGSDINFFLEGGTALGENRGEQITLMETIILKNILLVNPHIAIPSSAAYKLINLPSLKPPNLQTFNPSNLQGACFNRLEAGIRKAYPEVDALIKGIHDFGAEVAMLSGSGSTCFGLFKDQDTLQACKQAFTDKDYWTFETATIPAAKPILK
ncbi:MAG: 4-(cytidine 5'-diphospho)-2-C-methyl-D-erythritol kinase [Candidatus Cloacimonas sp.]|jgi:4-diphosphocytidyl-2-C-methyl-D-erythritol kinase|nr:4-(cytidine 5'-diphospho)-2-C-methyl-D-erythritol kinase [Candidatus Cloacimonas sp.]